MEWTQKQGAKSLLPSMCLGQLKVMTISNFIALQSARNKKRAEAEEAKNDEEMTMVRFHP